MDDHDYNTKLDRFTIVLLIMSGGLLILSLLAPVLLTFPALSKRFDFTNTGQIGDTIGGLTSPFIGLSAVIVTGLAFYMQYRANILQVSIFRRQLQETKDQFSKEQENDKEQMKFEQFESQFFEMIRLHKENVNELSIISLESGKTISRRQVFVTMAREFGILLAYTVLVDMPITALEFETAYGIFFWGYHEEDLEKLSPASQTFISGEGIIGGEEGIVDFSGHQGYSSDLGHYFRHLFMMVKFVVYSDIVTGYDDKMKYLKILRAQLSNHEQIMLFYNWMSKYGAGWENEENQFFTEYCMIHNLWRNELFQNDYILDKVKELQNKPVKFRKTPLFEYQE